MRSRSIIAAVVFVAAAVGGGVYYQQRSSATTPSTPAKDGGKGGGGAPQRGVPVVVAAVEQRDVPYRLNVVGRTEALASVTLRARVDGQIRNVNFKAGQHVKKGQPMITLDDRALRAQVDQGAANLARDRAQLDKAKSDLDRQTDLLAKGFISPATLEGFKATVQTLEATVRADQAALDLARVNLSYTVITSPMEGVAGAVLAFPGGSVKANDTALVVINQINPLYVTFSLPESQLKEINRDRSAARLKVEARPPGAESKSVFGELVFIDNTVDTTTGTIQMKAQFDNSNEALTSGQFVEVSMTVRDMLGALLMPSEALQAGPNGNFVYVAKPDQTVEVRPVVTLQANRQLLIVEKGLNPGERVVIDGQLRLTPGAKYEVREVGAKGGGKGTGKGGDGAAKGEKGGKGAPAKAGAPGDAPVKAAAPAGKAS